MKETKQVKHRRRFSMKFHITLLCVVSTLLTTIGVAAAALPKIISA